MRLVCKSTKKLFSIVLSLPPSDDEEENKEDEDEDEAEEEDIMFCYF